MLFLCGMKKPIRRSDDHVRSPRTLSLRTDLYDDFANASAVHGHFISTGTELAWAFLLDNPALLKRAMKHKKP